MPISTERAATCRYSKAITQCPLPPDCNIRIPINKKHVKNNKAEQHADFEMRQKQSKIELFNSGVCKRIPTVKTEGDIND